MSKQYAVIGLGKFGFSVATTLAQAGKENVGGEVICYVW